jgi:nitrous oxidase accessory protein NosD
MREQAIPAHTFDFSDPYEADWATDNTLTKSPGSRNKLLSAFVRFVPCDERGLPVARAADVYARVGAAAVDAKATDGSLQYGNTHGKKWDS